MTIQETIMWGVGVLVTLIGLLKGGRVYVERKKGPSPVEAGYCDRHDASINDIEGRVRVLETRFARLSGDLETATRENQEQWGAVERLRKEVTDSLGELGGIVHELKGFIEALK